MGTFSIWHLLVVLIIAMLLFGAGRVADIGKGLGEGIRNFKKGMSGDDDETPPGDDKIKAVDPEPEKEEPRAAPKQLVNGTKKKVIQIEVDEDVDEEELVRQLAKKKAPTNEKAG